MGDRIALASHSWGGVFMMQLPPFQSNKSTPQHVQAMLNAFNGNGLTLAASIIDLRWAMHMSSEVARLGCGEGVLVAVTAIWDFCFGDACGRVLSW